MSARRGRRRSIRLIAAIALFAGVLLPLRAAAAQPSSQTSTAIARLGVRVTSPAPSRTISGVVFAVDSAGRAVLDLEPQTLQASVDGKPVQLSSVGGRPSIALAAAFLLDSSASPRVRDSVAERPRGWSSGHRRQSRHGRHRQHQRSHALGSGFVHDVG